MSFERRFKFQTYACGYANIKRQHRVQKSVCLDAYISRLIKRLDAILLRQFPYKAH